MQCLRSGGGVHGKHRWVVVNTDWPELKTCPAKVYCERWARIDISPSGLWLKMLGRCPGTWSERFPTSGKVYMGGQWAQRYKGMHREVERHRGEVHGCTDTNTTNTQKKQIITTMTSSQAAAAEKWFGVCATINWSQEKYAGFANVCIDEKKITWKR